MHITVAGAGIIGLSCAYRLAGAGYDVTVVAAAPPGETTSAVAGGVLYPPVRVPDKRIVRWTAATWSRRWRGRRCCGRWWAGARSGR